MASDGAGAGGRKHTRFPCLAKVRYMVAAVVAVLTIVVAMKMIIVYLRPEDIQLSILQGHIEASALWTRRDDSGEIDVNFGSEEVASRRCTAPTCETNVIGANLGVGIGAGQHLTARSAAGTAVVEGEDDDEGDEPRCAALIVTYSAAPSVRLRVTLSAYNPSGRVDVNCTDTTLRIVDLPSEPNITGMVEVAWLAPPKGFLVRHKSSHTVTKWVPVAAEHVRSYIATAYAGKTSFEAMVQVNTTLKTVSWNKTPKNVTNGCGPVTVGLDEPAMSADPVNCRPIQVFGSVSSWTLAPAPAPAPAVPA